MHIHSLKRAALAACAVAVLAGPAAAEAVTTKLRVEAGGKDIGPGLSYVHDSVTYKTSKSEACNGSGESGELNGPTALGLLVQASDFTRGLRPVQISDEFEFGLLVCGVGGYESSDTSYWLYKVDHVAPEVGGEQFAIKRSHDEVLWYFVNGPVNSGSELGLRLSSQVVQAGKSVEVTALQYDESGAASAAEGVELRGAGDTTTGSDGKARVTFDKAGKRSIRGERLFDIPTEELELCVWEEKASECDQFLAGWVVGTDRDDRMRGTPDPERITGRRGDDRINSRGGKADSVRCGPGEDVARVDQRDRVKRNCETVKRK
jgi:hypothetical protein